MWYTYFNFACFVLSSWWTISDTFSFNFLTSSSFLLALRKKLLKTLIKNFISVSKKEEEVKKLKEKVSDIVHQEDKTKQAKLKLVLLIMAPLMLVTVRHWRMLGSKYPICWWWLWYIDDQFEMFFTVKKSSI